MTLNFWFSCPHLLSARITGKSHPNWFYAVLEIELKAFCILDEQSTDLSYIYSNPKEWSFFLE